MVAVYAQRKLKMSTFIEVDNKQTYGQIVPYVNICYHLFDVGYCKLDFIGIPIHKFLPALICSYFIRIHINIMNTD